jgi:PTH1 family peptidyl-tRNA hydrolase
VKIVLGVGNPGREHEATRHNVGFRVLDRVAEALGAEIRRRKFRGLVGDATHGSERVILVKPTTYVNAAGECARQVIGFYDVPIESFLAVLDDVNLPLGAVRCRRGGSSGGHNGLKSLIRHLGTDAFARLRVGVGRPEGKGSAGGETGDDLVGHVLGTFSKEGTRVAEAAEGRAAEAVLDWVLNGVEHCMNEFNRSPRRPATPEGPEPAPP